MAQNCLDIKKDGIDSIQLGKPILNEDNFLPIKEFNEKERYDIQIDESRVFFLKHEVINNSGLFKGVYNLFVVLEEDKKIQAINVLLNSEMSEIIQSLKKTLGEYQLQTSSGPPGYSQTKSYVWMTDSKNFFSLQIHKYLGTGKNQINLLIYSNSVQYPGEMSITEWQEN